MVRRIIIIVLIDFEPEMDPTYGTCKSNSASCPSGCFLVTQLVTVRCITIHGSLLCISTV